MGNLGLYVIPECGGSQLPINPSGLNLDVGRFTFEGVKVMGDKGGKKDKAKKEKQTAAKHTLKEKRKVKKEKQI